MKLPEDKSRRIKILVAAAMAAALVILGIVQGIIGPLTNARNEKLDRVKECQDALDQAREDIRQAAKYLKVNLENVHKIKDASDKYILQPVLGNYLLEATEIIEKLAKSLDIAIDPVREIGVSEMPTSTGQKAPNVLKCYTVRITFDGGYRDIVRFVREVENTNPYATIVEFSIRGQSPAIPDRHKVSVDIQWPIWTDSGTPRQMQQQLEEEINL